MEERARRLGLTRKKQHAEWCAADDNTLREHYAKGSAQAALPHKTINPIRQRARKLGLQAVGAKPWTAREDAVLHARYPKGGSRAVQRALPRRSKAAIHLRAHLLEVRHEPTDTPWSTKEIRALHRHASAGLEALRAALPRRSRAEIIRQCDALTINRLSTTHWTVGELARLRRKYANGGMEASLAAFPHRSERAIEHALEEDLVRGLRSGQARPRTDWTPERVHDLRELYPKGGSALMRTKHPGVRAGAIVLKAHHLGLSAPPPDNYWRADEDRICRLHYPAGGAKAVHLHLPHRSVHAINGHAARLGLSRPKAGRDAPIAAYVTQSPR